MSLSRTKAAGLAVQTATILKLGRYNSSRGRSVNLGDEIRAARQNTVEYPPEAVLPAPEPQSRPTTIEVVNETTLAAARRLHEAGLRPMALNFASAKNPGGGFLTGARAQEESLCRNSALFACLERRDYYTVHRNLGGALYTSYALYSPDVPVIRDESNELLDQPWPLAFITSAAPNAGALRQAGQYSREAVESAFEERIRKLLSIGAAHNHPAIVLGAWACGAFGNDAADVAPIFGRILRAEFSGVFEKVVFAVLDSTPERRTVGPFEVEFGL